jgi:ABC-type nitrate/sulfonate/bicarbonate transport system substrate-binding protein
MKSSKLMGWLLAAALGLGGAAAQAEVSDLKLMSQFGIGYMQLTVMKHEKLVEKHLAKAGLPNTKVTWATLGTGASANDALLSGGLHFAAGGTGPAFILWDRTRGNVDVRGVAALSSMPNLLVTRNPNVKTIRDFTAKDRIAMAGAGSSVQTTYLQMAVAKEFGADNFKQAQPADGEPAAPRRAARDALGRGRGHRTVHLAAVPEHGAGEPEREGGAQLVRRDGRTQHVPDGVGDQQVPQREPEELQGVPRCDAEATDSSTPTSAAPPRST